MKSKIFYLALILGLVGIGGLGYQRTTEINSVKFMQQKFKPFKKEFKNVLPVKVEEPQEEVKEVVKPKAVGPESVYVELNSDNAQLIAGKWRLFHKAPGKQSEFLNVIVNFNLTQDSEITIDRDVAFKVAAWDGRYAKIFRKEKSGKVQVLEALKIGKDIVGGNQSKSKLVAADHLKLHETLMALKEFNGGPLNIRQEDIIAEMILAPNEIVDLQISVAGNNLINLGHISLGTGGAFGVNSGTQDMISGIFYNRNTIRFTTGPLAGAALVFAPQNRFPSSEEEENENLNFDGIAVDPAALANVNFNELPPPAPAMIPPPMPVAQPMANLENRMPTGLENEDELTAEELTMAQHIDPEVLMMALEDRSLNAQDDANQIL